MVMKKLKFRLQHVLRRFRRTIFCEEIKYPCNGGALKEEEFRENTNVVRPLFCLGLGFFLGQQGGSHGVRFLVRHLAETINWLIWCT